MTILVALGGNLPSDRYGSPLETLRAAIEHLDSGGVRVERRSQFYTSPAWPPSEDPDYVNAVIAVATEFAPAALMDHLLRVERKFGRVRSLPNAPRPLDLDLLAYDDLVIKLPDGSLELPHPRLAARAFVLLPLRDVAPGWRHPATGRTVEEMLAELDLSTIHAIEP